MTAAARSGPHVSFAGFARTSAVKYQARSPKMLPIQPIQASGTAMQCLAILPVHGRNWLPRLCSAYEATHGYNASAL